MVTPSPQETPMGVTEYKTQAESNNELGLKIVRLYQEIDRLKNEVNFWRRKYEDIITKDHR